MNPKQQCVLCRVRSHLDSTVEHQGMRELLTLNNIEDTYDIAPARLPEGIEAILGGLSYSGYGFI